MVKKTLRSSQDSNLGPLAAAITQFAGGSKSTLVLTMQS